MRVNSMLAVRPPMTMIASGCCICAPGPMPRASGNRPRIAARLVIRIGRKRVRPASSSAGRSSMPSCRSCWMYSTSRMPFFMSRPISRIAPM